MQTETASLKATIFYYFIPFFLWMVATYYYAPLSFSWWVLLIGIVVLTFGSALFQMLLTSLPKKTADIQVKTVLQEIPKVEFKTEDPNPQLLEEIELLKEQLTTVKTSYEKLSMEHEWLNKEKNTFEKNLQNLKSASSLELEETERRVQDLKEEIHQKDLASQQLENQIQDLRYEIKTLLQLTEERSNSYKATFKVAEESSTTPALEEIHTVEDSKTLLKRCLEALRKLTPAYKRTFGNQPQLLDQRRLADTLNRETSALILIYSSEEQKLTYVSPHVRKHLGYNPESFLHEFPHAFGNAQDPFKSAAGDLLTKTEILLNLNISKKDGSQGEWKCLLSQVPSGTFRGYIIGVCYSQ